MVILIQTVSPVITVRKMDIGCQIDLKGWHATEEIADATVVVSLDM